MFLNCGVGEDFLESLGQQGDQPVNPEDSLEALMLKLSSSTLATWCEELTHWKRPWCWERLRAGGEGGNRGWDGWMASPTQWTLAWANSGRQWRTGKPSVLPLMESKSQGQGRLVSFHSWGHKDTTEGLNANNHLFPVQRWTSKKYLPFQVLRHCLFQRFVVFYISIYFLSWINISIV